jgi:ribosome-associated protein
MVKIAVAALEEKKGEDIKIIDIHGVSVIADYFVLASATNNSQLHALVDSVEEKLFKAGYECKQKEGNLTSTWMLMDYNDVIVHVFSQEDRLFYDLERIWRDGKVLESTDEL